MLFDAILIQPKKANVMQSDFYVIIFFCMLINQNSLSIGIKQLIVQNLISLHQFRFHYIVPNTFEASMNILHLIVQNLLLLHQFRFNYIQKQT